MFRAAVSIIKETDKHKYIYATTKTQYKCIDKLAEEITDEAVRKELAQMLDRHVWQPVHQIETTDKKLIISSKACLAEGGHIEDRVVFSSNEITSLTIATQSIFTIAAIAIHEGRDVTTGDLLIKLEVIGKC